MSRSAHCSRRQTFASWSFSIPYGRPAQQAARSVLDEVHSRMSGLCESLTQLQEEQDLVLSDLQTADDELLELDAHPRAPRLQEEDEEEDPAFAEEDAGQTGSDLGPVALPTAVSPSTPLQRPASSSRPSAPQAQARSPVSRETQSSDFPFRHSHRSRLTS